MAKPSWKSVAVWVVVLAVIGGGSFYAWRRYSENAAATQAKANQKPPPAPVTVADVRRADFPVYLTGLGTVEPYDTVTVSSRVDGEITKVLFRQGQMVKEGDTLVEIDPRPYQAALDQATSKKASDEATEKNAELNLQRYKTLGEKDYASQQQVDTQQATVDQLKAQIKGDDAAIANAQTELSYTTIKSPLTGRTGFRLVDPGNIVHASGTAGIVTVVKLQPISVVFTAPEEDIPRINKALAAGEVPVDAMSSDGKTLISTGHLALVNNEVDQASGDIRMKATFANEHNELWPGLSVSTRLLVDTVKNELIIPVDAVQRGPNGLFVYVVGKDNKVRMQKVEDGGESQGQALITSGLQEGESVVVEGQSRIADGALVQPQPEPSPSPSATEAAVTSGQTH